MNTDALSYPYVSWIYILDCGHEFRSEFDIQPCTTDCKPCNDAAGNPAIGPVRWVSKIGKVTEDGKVVWSPDKVTRTKSM